MVKLGKLLGCKGQNWCFRQVFCLKFGFAAIREVLSDERGFAETNFDLMAEPKMWSEEIFGQEKMSFSNKKKKCKQRSYTCLHVYFFRRFYFYLFIYFFVNADSSS